MFRVNEKTVYDCQYFAYAATCTEVELDVLTGENRVTRVDMLYDVGQRSVYSFHTDTEIEILL